MLRAAALLATLAACSHPQHLDPPVVPVAAVAPPEPRDPAVPLDPSVITGTLPNGLTYVITPRATTENEQVPFVIMAVRAGSLDETDAQTGAAHLLVHYLAPQLGIVDDVDADVATGFDSTTYPLELEDGAPEATFDERLATLRRAIDGPLPALELHDLHGELAPEPPPALEWLGTRRESHPPSAPAEHYAQLTAAEVAGFRKTWYRADRIAVIVVATRDPAATQRMIAQRFGDLPVTAPPPVRAPFELPPRTDLAIALRPTMRPGAFTLGQRVARHDQRTERGYRAMLVEQIAERGLMARMRTLVRRPDLAFERSPLTDSVDLLELQSRRGDQVYLVARELARLAANAITQDDLDSWRTELDPDHVPDSRAQRDSLTAWFLTGTPVPSAALDAVTVRLAATITADEVRDVARAEFALATRTLTIRTRVDEPRPIEAEVRAKLETIARMPLGGFADRAGAHPMMTAPQPGTIVATREDHGMTLWTLGNGARVIVRPLASHHERDTPGAIYGNEVELVAIGTRGYQRMPAARAASARFAGELVANGGLGELSRETAEEVMTESSVDLEARIAADHHAIHVSTWGHQVDRMFEVMHLAIAAPRVDPTDVTRWRARLLAKLAAGEVDADDWSPELRAAVGSAPSPPVVRAAVEAVDRDVALAAYADAVGDVAHTTFIILGESPGRVKPLVETYLASLPAGATQLIAAPPPRATGKPTVATELTLGRTMEVVFVAPPAKDGSDERDLDILRYTVEHRMEESRHRTGVEVGIADDGHRFVRVTSSGAVALAAPEIVLADIARHPPVGVDLEQLVAHFAGATTGAAWLARIEAGIPRGVDPIAINATLTDPAQAAARIRPALIQATARAFGKPIVRLRLP